MAASQGARCHCPLSHCSFGAVIAISVCGAAIRISYNSCRNSALPRLRQLLFPRWTVPGTLSLKAYDSMLQVDNKQGGRLRIPFELVHCST
jgi:hypothetical protein